MVEYTLFVDESGQSGIKNISVNGSGGASEYMTLGAVLVPNTGLASLRTCLADITKTIGKKDLHCSRLNHNQIVYFCQQLASEQIMAFGVISKKSTLGSYGDDIEANDKLYYNKCAQYLLEKVGQFMEREKIGEEQLTVLFEEGNFDYTRLRGLIAKCRKKPMHHETKNLKNVSPASIKCRAKADEPLLQAADLVAHALYRCVEKNKGNLWILETRYVQELRGKFFSDKSTHKVTGFGVKAVHNLIDIKLASEVNEFFVALKAN